MMYGHVETLDGTGRAHAPHPRAPGRARRFRAFISWTFQADGNRLAAQVPRETMPTSFDYLLTQAVSRSTSTTSRTSSRAG